jgi:serine/threonine protein kinase/Tol biopolymer transport system component
MPLAPNTQLGPYRILAPIGAGGMGEVYRAIDTRLDRQVAVKVLSKSLSQDPEHLRRFDQEARAVGMLNHPNVVAIYDVGDEGDTHFIVSELLEGQSLRARIREGPVPPRKAVEYAIQIARGLAAAHEKGIIHRDLKPENVFILRDGQVKLLDFGLAKLVGNRVPSVTTPGGGLSGVHDDITIIAGDTEPGRVMGTVGYMAPEQVRGGSGDHRSDIFSFGSIFFEMLTGRRAFTGESPIETLNAILKDEPPEITEINRSLPANFDRVIRHCLEKSPDERFQSARDLVFDLGALAGYTSQSFSFISLPRLHPRRMIAPALIALAALGVAAAVYYAGTKRGTQPPPQFHRLTFRSGTIFNARFAPDGDTIFYGAKWAGAPIAIFTVRSDSPESRDLGFASAEVLSISSSGKLAISLGRHPIGYIRESGTLAVVPIAGGAPRRMLEDVEAADWAPDGNGIAVVRTLSGRSRLEYPIGKVVADTIGWISHPRFSRDGNSIAYLEHPFLNDDRGVLMLHDFKSGKRRPLTPEWDSVEGTAWSPDGKYVWFAASTGSISRAIRKVDLRGKVTLVADSPGPMVLHDISRTGRVLITHEILRAGIVASTPADPTERDLSWLDYSIVRDLSDDGKTILFSESGEAGGAIYGVYVRGIDGSPAVRIGDGTSEDLSPDGSAVLSIPLNRKPAPIAMLPTGTGQSQLITRDKINHRLARWFPDGKRVLFLGNEPGKSPRLYVQEIGGEPLPAAPEGVSGTLVTRDGKRLLGRERDRTYSFYDIGGGGRTPVPAIRRDDTLVRFSDDEKSIFVSSFAKVPAQLTKVDLTTGAREPWRTVMPADPAGLINVGPLFVTSDGKTTVYSYTRLLSNLYLLDVTRK